MTKATINQTLSVKDPPKVKADILLAATTLYHNLLLAVKGLERKNKEGGKKKLPKRVKKLNSFGKWLYSKTTERGITFQELAKPMGTSKYYLSYLMYNSDLMPETMANWKSKAEKVLKEMK